MMGTTMLLLTRFGNAVRRFRAAVVCGAGCGGLAALTAAVREALRLTLDSS
ncbi:hypothetical protein VSX61_17025 [Brenneria populi subsp. brevivirga]|uniref:hypothetical protein n=1 Tax=Brenneria populi TaxID=1505588 RepID=UPI002E1999C4|nr:hypothetical protein [Brenneria populi subsp. brevivirga]